MKKLAILLSILLAAGLSAEAQRRPAKSSDPKSYKRSERKENKSNEKSRAVVPINSQRSRNTVSRNVSTPVVSRKSTGTVLSRADRRANVNNVSRVVGRVAVGNRIARPDRRPVSVAHMPIVNNIKIRHGYIDYNTRYGYSMHRIMTFPMRVRYPFYSNYNLLLMHSYRPQIEYPWAIYESENHDNTASIEGQVIDVDYNRMTNQYVLHFGRKSPYQSATVIIPDYLSQYLDMRDLRKLKRDYVSVYGLFTQYGNVPTIMINSLDEFYVNEMSLRDYLYYH